MRIQWLGQSAFRLATDDATVVVDPMGDVAALAARGGLKLEYPPIEGIRADLVLVTHEHADHNGVDRIEGDPIVVRSTAGRFDSPVGEVVAIASEHDDVAGTKRGPNTIFVFELGGVRVAHFGDFGQRALRDEQAAAIGALDLLLVPIGGGPTLDAEQAAQVVERLRPRWIVPMHYRTHRVDWLEPPDAFLERMAHVVRLPTPEFDTAELPGDTPLTIVPAAP
ncbi:MAG TPA: MBL fold metallo-hydrolase [Solirubrobacteraceae bacterium]|nr:MBL fold metallo-hydrolase [Solirubrobacteraceae bacterium]